MNKIGIFKNNFQPWTTLIFLLVPINLMMALDRSSFALAAPQIGHSLNLNYVQISIVISGISWSYAIMQLPGGWFVQIVGARRALGLACLLWSITTMLMPISAGFMSFLVLRIAMGVFQAPDWSASIVAIHDWFPQGKRPRANAMLLGFLYLGSTLAGPLTTEFTLIFGWEKCLFVFGVVGTILSVLWLIIFRNGPFHTPAKSIKITIDKKTFHNLVSSGKLWAIGGFYFCVVAIQSFYHATLPQYLISARHLSYLEMGWVFSLPWFCLYGSVVVSGFLSDFIYARSGSHFWARTVFGSIGAIISAVFLYSMALCHNNIIATMLLCMALAALGPCQVTVWSIAQRLTNNHTAIVVGWTGFCGNVSGGIVPIITALLLKSGMSWSLALSFPCLLGVCGAFFCLIAGREVA